MRRILALLPDALICVDEREVGDYRPLVPERQLIPHPPTENLPQVRNWIIKNIDCRCQVQVDDDLKRVLISDGFSQRVTKDPDEIQQFLVNAANICADVGIGAFAFTRQANPALSRPDEVPFRLVSAISATFGILGPARDRLFDERFLGRDDFDWTMRTLIEDRIVFVDNRVYFDHGPAFAGRGGNVGIVDQRGFDNASRLLKQLYGSAIEFSAVRFAAKKNVSANSKTGMVLRVERRQSSVYC